MLLLQTRAWVADSWQEASFVMHRLSYATETVLSNEITRNRIVLSFKDSPRHGRQRPMNSGVLMGGHLLYLKCPLKPPHLRLCSPTLCQNLPLKRETAAEACYHPPSLTEWARRGVDGQTTWRWRRKGTDICPNSCSFPNTDKRIFQSHLDYLGLWVAWKWCHRHTYCLAAQGSKVFRPRKSVKSGPGVVKGP